MKFEIVKKAFIVWHRGMLGYRPEFYDDINDIEVTYAKSPGEAKAWCGHRYDYDIDGKDATFLDLRVKRAKWADKIKFEDRIVTRGQAERALESAKRIEKRRKLVEKYPDDTMFYIQRGYVGNAMLFWGLNSNGYTCKLDRCQKYTKSEVLKRFLDSNPDDRIWPADHIESNTSIMVDGQNVSGKLVI